MWLFRGGWRERVQLLGVAVFHSGPDRSRSLTGGRCKHALHHGVLSAVSLLVCFMARTRQRPLALLIIVSEQDYFVWTVATVLVATFALAVYYFDATSISGGLLRSSVAA